ncbi:hypothetical protein F4810DRAFT_385809 [Camillea tinctor]|nr:hypothetical protein F4810DRAFT_385809 [Camillea tinctor]
MFAVGILRKCQLSPLRRNIVTLRSVALRPAPRTKLQTSCFKRFETNSANNKSGTNSVPPGDAASPKRAYPERLCVYHAGTTRIMMVACLKVSTLFMFVFFVFVVTPLYIDKEGLDLSPNIVRSALSGIIPLAFVAYTTAPFVTFIHLRLPPYARQSKELLARFVKHLPPDTELEITTMNFLAKPRISKVKISDLKPSKSRFGLVSLTRDTKAENAKRKWYQPRAVGQFSVQSNTMPRVPWVWGETSKMINKRKP